MRIQTYAAGRSSALRLALLGCAGLAYAAAFPPLSWRATIWLALAPLMGVCAGLTPRRAAAAALCWTAAAALALGWFLPATLASYFGLATPAAWLATLAVVLLLHGTFVAAYAAWIAWLAARQAASPALLAGGWLICELARTSGPLASPWALTAYSQIGWAPIVQSADIGGPYAIGLLVAAVNACAAAVFVPALRGRRPALSLITTAAAVAAAVLYGEWRLSESFAHGPAIRIAVVQGGAAPADPAQRPARLDRHLTMSREAAAGGAELIVWPEHAVEAYLEEPTPTREAVLALSAESGADLLLGGPHFEPARDGIRYHNSAYLIRAGRLAGRYDKRRLVPFAEQSGPTPYTPGSEATVLPGGTARLGTLLCVEAMFPGLARAALRNGAEVLVNLSNDVWFASPAAARQQLDIATLRAVETRRYLVRAAATGISAVIDPHGRVVARSVPDRFEVLAAAVHAGHARTPYQRHGDALAWLVAAAAACATLRAAVRRASMTQRQGGSR